MDIDKLGLFIQERRKTLNLTQQELADQVGVTNKAVSKWERRQSIPDIALFKDLAHCLNVEVIDLFSAGDLMEKDQVAKKEVESIMEKAYEVVLKFNAEKVIKVVYYLVMLGCTLGLVTTTTVDYILNKQLTWSIISTTSILGAMFIVSVIRFTYTNVSRCIFATMLAGILISMPIIYSVGVYFDNTLWVMNEVLPVLFGTIGAVITSYIYFIKSTQNTWVKLHVSIIILDMMTTTIQFFVIENKIPFYGNLFGLAILIVTLPLTINAVKNK